MAEAMTASGWDDPVEALSTEECWTLLGLEEVGRLAFRLVDEVHIVPINYVVDASTLLFRTTAGNKLLAAAMHADVAFEIDFFDDREAWSVVVRGRLHRVGEADQHRAEDLGLRTWVPTLKYDVVELVPHAVTGRRFHLARAGS